MTIKTKYRAYASGERSFADDPDTGELAFQGALMGAEQLVALVEAGEIDPAALLEDDEDIDEGERAFADHTGMVLAPSRYNPSVRRWIKLRAKQHLDQRTDKGAEALGKAAMNVGVAGAVMHHAGRASAGPTLGAGALMGAVAVGSAVRHLLRNKRGRWGVKATDDATSPQHYLTHHKDTVASFASAHKVDHQTVAHAMAFWGRHHLNRGHNLGEKVGVGAGAAAVHHDLGHMAVKSFKHGASMVGRGMKR